MPAMSPIRQAIDAVVLAVARDHDARLVAWFAGPPQTNEAGRSAGIMAQLLWLSGRLGPRFELIEIGSSAGINTMMERFGFDLGGVKAGRAGSPMLIQPEWRGPAAAGRAGGDRGNFGLRCRADRSHRCRCRRCG